MTEAWTTHPVSLFTGYIYIHELIKKSCVYAKYTMPVAMALGYKHSYIASEKLHTSYYLRIHNR